MTSRYRLSSSELSILTVTRGGVSRMAAMTSAVNSSPSTLARSSNSRASPGTLSIRSRTTPSVRSGSTLQSRVSDSSQNPSSSWTTIPLSRMLRRSSMVNRACPWVRSNRASRKRSPNRLGWVST